ncbi:MAG TPA: exodeoxyribonuclease VII small subunit [Candidatus Hydrogenedentes bacterium]|nr:exodeoxyribonuclease VII small subunit [Candidatus Hydrogenedentota bacterium]HOL75839.1 exodeoxyribonuclease VII small subunit [Candidatus Hydrogenedentota bacterium]HPO86341.1 exodeoxyribonuclease VII small subunit [Candidatus Hydrogenedentota bacterium]
MASSSFEKDLERLEKIVEALEQGDLSLDESLKRFEEGIKLAKRCEKALTEAEKKIEILMKDAQGNIQAEPFGDEEPASSQETEESEDSDPSDEDSEEEENKGLLF